MRISLSQFRLGLLAPIVTWALVGCGGNLGLPPTQYLNVVDTTTLYALHGTPIPTPSGFDLVAGVTRRVDLGQTYDIAFDYDSTGAAVLYSSAVLGGVSGVGMRVTDQAFDAITRAPTDKYAADSLLTLSVDLTFFVRSRAATDYCSFLGAVPRYGKFHVLALDASARTVTLEHLIDLNCGYLGLEPGAPPS